MKPLFFKYTIDGKEYEVRSIVFPYVFSRCGKRYNLKDVEPATGWSIQILHETAKRHGKAAPQ